MQPFSKRQRVLGWVAVSLSTIITCIWAFWGGAENFHEGWYYPTFIANLGLMFAQYLSPMLIFMGITLLSIRWPRLGGGLHVAASFLAAWFFNAFTNTVIFLLLIPFIGFGLLYWFGRPQPRKLALYLAFGLPLITLILSGIGPAIRVSQRIDDGNRQARLVEGNGVTLTWAPTGPGWPDAGMNWSDAGQTCLYLEEDGTSLSATQQDIWRLPTVDEAVRSMALHGQNSGGVWDADNAEATYLLRPDKESPLWDPHSQVIYWWTATEADQDKAYIIVYDGKVWPRSKQLNPDYIGFRCVK